MPELRASDMTSREGDYQLVKKLSVVFKDCKEMDYVAIQELLTIPGVYEFFTLCFYDELREGWLNDRKNGNHRSN
jgi:hypothetical protein